MNDVDIIDAVLEREGGFVDHPADRGGPTNWGITMPALREWIGRPPTLEDLKALTREEAFKLLLSRYSLQPGFGEISDIPLRAFLVDCSVHHGPARAVKILQGALDVDVDGKIGPNTRAALKAAKPAKVLLRAVAERIRFMGRIVSNDHSQAAFASGWLVRATEFLDHLSESI